MCQDITLLPQLASAPLTSALTSPQAEERVPAPGQSVRGWFTALTVRPAALPVHRISHRRSVHLEFAGPIVIFALFLNGNNE